MKQVQDGNRKLSLGGSDAAAVLGLSDYSSPFDIWVSKTSEEPEEIPNNPAMYWGTIKEKVVAEHYAARHEVSLIESPKRCNKHEWQTGTPDRLIIFNGENPPGEYYDPVSNQKLLRRGVEFKTANNNQLLKWGMCGNVGISRDPAPVITSFEQAKGTIPLGYFVQVQWYMDLMGFDQWDLAVLIGSADYREYRLLRDAGFIGWAVGKCAQFWANHVVPKIPPPIDHGSTLNKYLIAKHPEDGAGTFKKASAEEEEKAKELKRLEVDLKELGIKMSGAKMERDDIIQKLFEMDKRFNMLKEHKDALCSMFKDRIGSATGMTFSDGSTMTWTSTDKQSRTLRKRWK